MPENLEDTTLAEDMKLYFFHRDRAARFQHEFRSEQQSHLRELTAQATAMDAVRVAAVEFEKSSSSHALFKQAIRAAEEALARARAWYDTLAIVGPGDAAMDPGTDRDAWISSQLSSVADGEVRWNELATPADDISRLAEG
jgi:hypothetical protein